MSAPGQNSSIPSVVEPQRLARQSRNLEGVITAEQFGRLPDLVEKIQSPISASLHFFQDDHGFANIQGRIDIRLSLTCQRCLAQVEHHADVAINLTLLVSENQSAVLPKSRDWLVVEEDSLDLASLLEEEVILDLPMIPRHPEGGCHGPEDFVAGTDKTDQAVKKPNPFEVLNDLKIKG